MLLPVLRWSDDTEVEYSTKMSPLMLHFCTELYSSEGKRRHFGLN